MIIKNLSFKTFLFIFLVGSILAISSFLLYKKEIPYEDLMGKNTNAWNFVKTPKDHQDLFYYKTIYEQNRSLLNTPALDTHIPKIIHLIWLGPKNFPILSKENILSWIQFHPNWRFIFWTDIDRDCPVAGMEKKLFNEFPLHHLLEQYNNSSNFGEKSDLLRFEILNSLGGIYIDHDAKCFHSFDNLHTNFDFYVGLEPPHIIPGLPSCIFPCIGIFGSIPNHPILKETIFRIKSNWNNDVSEYLRSDNDLVVQRTFKNFASSTRTLIGKSSYKDMVLPASFFFSWDIFSQKRIKKFLKNHKVYLHHYWANTWENIDNSALKIQNDSLTLKVKTLQEKYKQKKILFYVSAISFFFIGIFIGRSKQLLYFSKK